jgi:SpoVK/Ycf46/Vps4 family AAA+-type ATPase
MQTIGIETYIRSGASAIFVQTQEEDRAVSDIKRVAHRQLKSRTLPSGYNCLTWTVSNGIDYKVPDNLDANARKREEALRMETQDPMKAMSVFIEEPEKVPRYTVLIMLDIHLHFKGNNPMLIRMLKDAIRHGRKTNRHIIMIGAEPIKHPELDKEIQVIDMPLPGRDVLSSVVEDMARAAAIETNGNTDSIITALAGLTADESANALAFSLASKKKFDIDLLHSIKTDTFRKNGIIEIVDKNVPMGDIGGLKRFKQHLTLIAKAWTKEARDFGVPQPLPILAVGNPGTAKSLSCMALKTIMGLPLLRLEAGRLFGSFVGESERNWRSAFSTAKAIGQCILWIDEAEALFGGMESSSKCDGGTTGRVVKNILQDMQMNSEGVFFAFTSNDIDGFPDPLIDRCDVWAFDLPDAEERASIWDIHIRKRGRKPADYSIEVFTEATDGFSGRQIEQAWIKSILIAFADGSRQPTDKDVLGILSTFIPTSITMKDQIERRRKRLHNRAQNASR